MPSSYCNTTSSASSSLSRRRVIASSSPIIFPPLTQLLPTNPQLPTPTAPSQVTSALLGRTPLVAESPATTTTIEQPQLVPFQQEEDETNSVEQWSGINPDIMIKNMKKLDQNKTPGCLGSNKKAFYSSYPL